MIGKVQVSISKQSEYRSLDVEILQEASLVICRPVQQEKSLNALIAENFITWVGVEEKPLARVHGERTLPE